jgi:peroxiredoxin
VTLSPQLPDFGTAWVEEDGIGFPVLLDLGNGVARDFGLTFRLPDDLRALYAEHMGIDLVRYNGDESWELPIPATFVVDRDGTIAYVSAHPDYTKRPEPTAVLAAIPEVGG